MRSIKILLLCLSVMVWAGNARAQTVQPLSYKDYSAPYQFNIGGGVLKTTHPSAFLELGLPSGSTKGLLLPRGNKDAIASPAAGLVIYDLPTQKLWWYTGSAWATAGTDTASGGTATTITYQSPIILQNGTVKWLGTTTNVPEGSNLYWLQSRFDAAFAAKTTTNLVEGLNLYYTNARVQTFGDTRYATIQRLLDSMAWARANLVSNQTLTQYITKEKADSLYSKTGAGSYKFIDGLFYKPTTNEVGAYYWGAIWNANKLQNIPIKAEQPLNGQGLHYNNVSGMWEPSYDSSFTGGSGSSLPLDSLYVIADPVDFEVSSGTSVVGVGNQFSLKQAYRDGIDHGETAYSWGNHSLMGYLTRDSLGGGLGTGRTYYNGYGLLKPNDSTFSVDSILLLTRGRGYKAIDSSLQAFVTNDLNNYIITGTGNGLRGEPDFQYNDSTNILSLGGSVHPDFRFIATGYVNGMTSRVPQNVAGALFGASRGGLSIQGFSDSLRYPGLRLQGYMSSTAGANTAPITMEAFRPGTTYYRQALSPTDTAFSLYSGARDSAGVLLMTLLGNGNVYFSGTVTGSTGTGTTYTFTNSSIINTANNLALSGDAATPGASKVYGTDASGTKGYQSTTIIDPTGFVVGDWIKKTATGFMRTPRLTITTTGTSGAATLDTTNNILNVPNYGAGVALTTTDNYLNVSGTTITTKKAWNTITWASSIIVNAATSSDHTVTLGGTTAISISNAQDGQVILLELVQDATGSRTVTWPSDVDWSWTATGTQPTLKTAAGAPNAITLTYKLATSKWYGTY